MIEEIKKIPKIELHLHLDGSVDFNFASKFSKLSLNQVKEKMIAKNSKNLDEYLTKFNFPISLLQTKDNLKSCAKALIDNLEKQNIIYAEIRFAPFLHTENLTYEEVLEAVLSGLKNSKIKTNLILCLMRNIAKEDNIKTIELAEKYLNKGVGGLDLAGDEALYPTSAFNDLFGLIKEKNIPFTIHAGEADGPSSISKAISFGAKRIGHGIRCIEDKELIKKIKKEHILLEICPTSNLHTKVIKEYKKHPIYELYNYGIQTCINTDNMSVSNITLTDEYIKLYETFNFSIEDFQKMNLFALDKAFISEKEKEDIKEKLIFPIPPL